MIDGFRYDDDPLLQAFLLPYLRRLRPMKVPGKGKIRVGRETDGGYVMLDDFGAIEAAYSFGIKDDVSWDLDVAQRGIAVWQYDHTIDRLPEQHPVFHWSKLGLGPQSGGDIRTLPDLVQANGHERCTEMLLKMDIEGHEWPSMSVLPSGFLHCFRQMTFELHGFQHTTEPPFRDVWARAMDRLTEHHSVVHVHANNNSGYAIVGGIPIPAVLEVTFVRNDPSMVLSDEVFPTTLDRPCWPGRADYALGTFAF